MQQMTGTLWCILPKVSEWVSCLELWRILYNIEYLFSLPSVVSLCGGRDSQHQEPITTRLQLLHIPVSLFSKTDLFLVSIISNSDPHRNLRDHDVGMFTWGRIVLFLPKCAHVDWNWPISREKYLKIDWSVKMPLHWLIYYGSCKLLVMGFW